MTKVLLVEDDNNLREIFEMRLQAEGYKTVTAGDGEEALVLAVKEKPDLVIADVMMPKLSGFEMVEGMRAAPELANTKVIMMTALGQAEDRARGDKLGVVKYLVKSQVTLEDFVRVVREVLPPDQDGAAPGASAGTVQPDNAAIPKAEDINKQESEQAMQDDPQQTPTNPPADNNAPAQDTASDTSNPISTPAPADSTSGEQQTTAQEQNAVNGQIDNFATDPNAGAAPAADDSNASGVPPVPPADTNAPEPPVGAPAGDAPATPPAPSDSAPSAPGNNDPAAPSDPASAL